MWQRLLWNMLYSLNLSIAAYDISLYAVFQSAQIDVR